MLHNMELHDLYCSPGIVRVVSSKEYEMGEHVAHREGKRNVYMVLVGNLREGDCLEDLDVDGRMILE